ncbi:hypothetical protein EYS14_02910 [Alteromonadaceae bacterium M269]|nr:hypothetical protein EYS14_02910 [Alteromonadaceae bacterium M269]
MIKKNFLKLIIACGLASSFSVLAQQDESYIAPLADQSLLLDIATSSTERLFVVGERGHILSSTNGSDWTQQQVPTESTLTAVHFEDNQGWVVGHDSVILHTTDAGANWQVQQFLPESERPLLDVLFLDDKKGIAIGAYGTYYETEDAGQSWNSVQHATLLSQEDQEYLEEIKAEDEAFYLEELGSILPHLNRIHRSGDKLYIAGESGLLAVSEDWGKSWIRLDVDYYGSFFDIANVENNGLYAAGLRGNVYRLDGVTERWTKIPQTGELSFNSLVQLPSNRVLAVGNNGASLMIDNKDETTYAQTEEGVAIVNGVWFKDQLVVVTAQGVKVLALDYLGAK